MNDELPNERVDVVVIGGGPAGLAAALTLGRVRRSVVVVDGGEPRNASSSHVHGYLSRDGMAPGDLLAAGRAEVAAYGVRLVAGRAVGATKGPDGDLDVELADGRSVRARRIVVTTGLVDELPDVTGVAERWGRDVLHCPYCHGWEVRDRSIVVLSSGPLGGHAAQLFRQLSEDVTLVVQDGDGPDAGERERLAARGITVVDEPAVGLVVVDDELRSVRLGDGRQLPAGAVVVTPRMVARSSVLEALGVEVVDHPMGVGRHVAVDATGRTSVAGVWAAGNVADLSANVALSSAAGVTAGAQVNADLIAEEVEAAMAAVAAPATTTSA